MECPQLEGIARTWPRACSTSTSLPYFLLVLFLFEASGQIGVPAMESTNAMALFDLCNACHPLRWNILCSYNLSDLACNAPNMPFVRCDDDHRVTELDLSYSFMNCTLPESLQLLGQLSVLTLSNNSIYGAIPAWIGKLTNLRTLYLDDNLLSGCLPVELNHLQLLDLKLTNNPGLEGPLTLSLNSCNISNTNLCTFSPNECAGSGASLCSPTTCNYHQQTLHCWIAAVPDGVDPSTRVTLTDCALGRYLPQFGMGDTCAIFHFTRDSEIFTTYTCVNSATLDNLRAYLEAEHTLVTNFTLCQTDGCNWSPRLNLAPIAPSNSSTLLSLAPPSLKSNPTFLYPLTDPYLSLGHLDRASVIVLVCAHGIAVILLVALMVFVPKKLRNTSSTRGLFETDH